MVSKIKKVKPPKAMRVKTLVGRKRGKGEGLTNEEGLTKGSGLVTKKVGENLKPVKEIVTGKNIRKTIMAKEGSSKNKQGEKTMTRKYGYAPRKKDKTDAMSVQKDAVEKKLKEEPRTIKQAKDAGKNYFINKAGKKLAAITKEELEASNMSLRDYLNKQKGLTRRDGKKVIKTTKKDNKLAQKMPVNKPGTSKSKSATQINRELRAKVKGPKKPTTDIFKVKKGESTTRAADAKKKQEAAQKKVGRGLTVKGEATPRKLSNEERRKNERLKRSFRIANQMKEGPGRDRAMERARKYMRKPLRGKLVDGPKAAERYSEILGTKNKNIKVANKAFGSNASDYTEIRMNKKSKGKGAGASLRGMGAVVK